MPHSPPRDGPLAPPPHLDARAPEAGFLSRASGSDLLAAGYVLLDYTIETTADPLKAALHFCQETSTALWSRPGVQEDYRPRHAALLVDLEVLEESDRPWAASAAMHATMAPATGTYTRARIRVGHPVRNFGPRLPNFLTVAMGEGAFFTPHTPVVRLEDVRFPDEFLHAFRGPRFGVRGIRALLGVDDRPLICGVVKPNIGLDAQAFADIAGEALRGGADIVKDDEMLADVEWSPTLTRAEKTFARVREASRATGEHKLYMVNVTDEVDRIIALHDEVHAIGGDHTAVMLNALPVGLSACRMLASHTRAPLFSHFDAIAPMTRVPGFGVSTLVVTRLLRLAGFDAIIMPGLGSRMGTRREDVLRDVAACLEPMGSLEPCLPVPGGSDWAGSLERLHRTLGTRDFSLVPGRGIFGHPQGPAAGARSIRDAWIAISEGISPRDYRDRSSALDQAYAEFEP